MDSPDSPTPPPLSTIKLRTPPWFIPKDQREVIPAPELQCDLRLVPFHSASTQYAVQLYGEGTLSVPMIDSLIAWLQHARDTASFLNGK